MATAKKAPAQKHNARAAASAKRVPAKATPAKKVAPAPAKSASKSPAKAAAGKHAVSTKAAGKTSPPKPGVKAATKQTTKPTAKPTGKAASKPTGKPAPAKAASATPVAKAAPSKAVAKAAPAPAKQAATKAAPAKAPVKKLTPATPMLPAPIKGERDGVKYTKDFDAKFLLAQRTLLLEEREALTGQAIRLEDEANALIEEQEMGDVQFDDEGGEGDTMVVERERDLALSAQARQTIADIDAALVRLTQGTYGYSLESGRPIGRERLEAIPWATVLVEEKVGGIGRR
jgi:RNA polymerase-binding transcription factor DksA